MSHFKTLALTAITLSFSQFAWSDSFDDAVNLYLQGFEHCSTAKSALSGGNAARAKSEFAKYENTKKQAVAVDGSILSSNKRGMSSNLKYCQRVGTDIEIELGRPQLEKAFAACELAISELKQGNIDAAKSHQQEFIQLRDEAIGSAPALNDVFSLRSKVRRCERTSKKIASAGQKQAEHALVLQSALESSEEFNRSCNISKNEISKAPLNEAAITNANNSLKAITANQQEAKDDYSAVKALSANIAAEQKTKIENNIKKGDQCVAQLSKQVQQKQQQLKVAEKKLASLKSQINSANQSCLKISKLEKANKAQYEQARSQFETTLKTRNQLKASIAKNSLPDGNGSNSVNSGMAKLNRCLDQSRANLGKLLATLSGTPKVAPQPKKKVVLELSSHSSIPALSVMGTISVSDIAPEFAVVYWLDGKQGQDSVDIVVQPSSFDQKIYFLKPGGTLKFISQDFATHNINASAMGENTHTKLRSRQRRSVKTNWPENIIASIRSDQVRLAESYVISLNTSNYKVFQFNPDSKQLQFELNNSYKVQKGFILMPDFDPIAFEIGQGDDIKLPISRAGTALGNIELKGI